MLHRWFTMRCGYAICNATSVWGTSKSLRYTFLHWYIYINIRFLGIIQILYSRWPPADSCTLIVYLLIYYYVHRACTAIIILCRRVPRRGSRTSVHRQRPATRQRVWVKTRIVVDRKISITNRYLRGVLHYNIR